MALEQLTITYVGGPTVLLGLGPVRLLTDPTFDPGGGEYVSGPVTLRKLNGPACSPQELGPFDYVLLSHDHHSDNLDHAGSVASIAFLEEQNGPCMNADKKLQFWRSSSALYLRNWRHV